MNIDRLRKIIQYSVVNREDIESKVKKFYSFTGISNDQDVLNIMQIVRPAFRKMRFLVLELPFADDEIGALCYKGDALGYILLNTSLPKVNANFAICHEIYHVFFQKSEFKSKVEFANDHYFEHEEEFAANLFAGELLMKHEAMCGECDVKCRRMSSEQEKNVRIFGKGDHISGEKPCKKVLTIVKRGGILSSLPR